MDPCVMHERKKFKILLYFYLLREVRDFPYIRGKTFIARLLSLFKREFLNSSVI